MAFRVLSVLLVPLTALNRSHCSPERLRFSCLCELRAGSWCVLLSTLEEASREAFVSSEKEAGIQQSPPLRSIGSIVWTPCAVFSTSSQNNKQNQRVFVCLFLSLKRTRSTQVEWISSGSYRRHSGALEKQITVLLIYIDEDELILGSNNHGTLRSHCFLCDSSCDPLLSGAGLT